MPPTTDEAIETYKRVSKNGSPRGAYAEFISLKNGWGIKIYNDEWGRNHHWEMQKQAAEHELGPEVGECLTIGDKFAYITEEVETLIKFSGRSYNQNSDFERAEKEFNDDATHYQKLNELVTKLEEIIGWDFGDCHIGNIGIKNGKYICIDFG